MNNIYNSIGSNYLLLDRQSAMFNQNNFSNWLPGSVINNKVREVENINTNWKYRKYLTRNADEIIIQNQLNACESCCQCPARYKSYPSHSFEGYMKTNDTSIIKETSCNTVPHLYTSCLRDEKPIGFEDSLPKKNFITRAMLASQMSIPSLNKNQLISRGIINFNQSDI